MARPDASVDDLAARLSGQVKAPSPTDTADSIERAIELLDTYTTGREVPEEILTGAVLAVGAELWHARTLQNGLSVFTSPDGMISPVRVNRDPLTPAYGMLRRYVLPGIA